MADGPRTEPLGSFTEEHGAILIFVLRLIPPVSFDAIGYVAHLSSIGFRAFLLAIALGMASGTFAFVYLGSSGSDPGTWAVLLGLAVLADAACVSFRRSFGVPRRVRQGAGVEARRAGAYDELLVSALGNLALAGLLALLLAAACSGPSETQAPEESIQDQSRDEGGRAREVDPVVRLLWGEEADGAIGERVDVGNVSLRVFAVRSEDVVYFAPGPGLGVGEKDSGSGEFLAVDFVAQNDSGSRVTVRPEAILGDDSGVSHRPDGSVRVPNLAGGAMVLEAGQKRASTLFFDVPNGTTPERLGLLVSENGARVDLLSDRRDQVPPDDYLRVYHLYFAQRAYEEAYEMYDPATTQDITQGDWLTFYEPLWGKRYIGLDRLSRVFAGADEASFEMDRTFYDSDGEPVEDPALNAPVLQDMVRSDGAWRLVMGQDLISAIAAEVPRFSPPTETETTAPGVPETTAPETKSPETTPETTTREATTREATLPETTASPEADYSCADFRTQEGAQSYLIPGDPYVLDPDGDGLACEELP